MAKTKEQLLKDLDEYRKKIRTRIHNIDNIKHRLVYELMVDCIINNKNQEATKYITTALGSMKDNNKTIAETIFQDIDSLKTAGWTFTKAEKERKERAEKYKIKREEIKAKTSSIK
ncbi:MAG: hypothetical protein H7836_15265 [Magnetococcus sp. YQC-3]